MRNRPSRRRFLVTIGFSALAGCISIGESDPSGSSGPPLREFTVPLEYELDELFDQVFLGFVERDPADPSIGVSDQDVAIDDPKFVDADDAILSGNEVVFGIENGGEAKAYPQKILVWNEIVNDVVGGEPICITYCPLTGSVVGFDRGDSSFGVSNQLVNSNLILFDRDTETWWPQILGAGIADDLRGYALYETPVVWTTWDRWRAAYPQTVVLDEETGFIRDYGNDPYGTYDPNPDGYYASVNLPREVMHEDDRLHPKEIVVGGRTRDGPFAFVKETLRRKKTETVQVGGVPYSGFYDESLDFVSVYRNPNDTKFRPSDGIFLSDDGTRFEADAIPLEQTNAFDVMWFAWFAFFPNTIVGSLEFTALDIPPS